jgi:flagellar biosynthesis protein FlhA
MDGATKFVRGDAIAGIIITLVNIIVGLMVGVWQRGFTLADAAQVYTKLTIGDGLVTQVPAVVISVAAGIIVTRTTSDTNLGADLGNQLRRYPRALGISAGILAVFGLVPGMPTVPFVAISLVLGLLAYQAQSQFSREAHAKQTLADAEAKAAEVEPEERTEDLLVVDPLKIELGYGLIQLADAKQGGDLLTRVQIIRQQMATKMGFIVPVVRIVDNMRLRPNEYVVKMREAEIARYELVPDHTLAMNPGLAQEEVPGIPTVEPAFGLQAVWVGPNERDRAEMLGYTIVEPSAVLATHLTELLMTHASEILTRQDTQKLVDTIKESAPSVVEELLPNVLNLGEVQKVLQSLLRERVSIRNLEVILETLADYGPRTRDVELLTEYSRHALGAAGLRGVRRRAKRVARSHVVASARIGDPGGHSQ